MGGGGGKVSRSERRTPSALEPSDKESPPATARLSDALSPPRAGVAAAALLATPSAPAPPSLGTNVTMGRGDGGDGGHARRRLGAPWSSALSRTQDTLTVADPSGPDLVTAVTKPREAPLTSSRKNAIFTAPCISPADAATSACSIAVLPTASPAAACAVMMAGTDITDIATS